MSDYYTSSTGKYLMKPTHCRICVLGMEPIKDDELWGICELCELKVTKQLTITLKLDSEKG